MIDDDKDMLLHLIHKWVFSDDERYIEYKKEMLKGSVKVMEVLLDLKESNPESFNEMKQQFELEQTKRSR